MEVEMLSEYGGDGVAEEQGWETPRREECRIPVVPPCPPPPPRKKAAELLKAARREPPKGGYFQPPDIESLFMLAPLRRQYNAASTCV
ncbi:uncharacterized protein [Lolium perenne]|uniref:uncharacterized protein n=1 Tax=Lolium perenne TaxID=4522 RepID=UPI0021EAFD89|nr:cyclin-dependent protein kinase inhibitor SMR4-like [Lolium perenne]